MPSNENICLVYSPILVTTLRPQQNGRFFSVLSKLKKLLKISLKKWREVCAFMQIQLFPANIGIHEDQVLRYIHSSPGLNYSSLFGIFCHSFHENLSWCNHILAQCMAFHVYTRPMLNYQGRQLWLTVIRLTERNVPLDVRNGDRFRDRMMYYLRGSISKNYHRS